MPIISQSKYQAPRLVHRNPHFSTIYAAKIKHVDTPNYKTEILELSDGDFLNIDYSIKSLKKAVILCHGLEGDSRRTYNNSCANYFLERDFSVIAWNNRTCGGHMNRLPQMYHHGSIEDLDAVVQFAFSQGIASVYIIGYSMGGAQVLNYLGKQKLDSRIKAAVAVSAPTHIRTCSDTLKVGFNKVYLNTFKKGIVNKLKQKVIQFPELANTDKINALHSFAEIDDYFTAPMHGFTDKDDYYEKVSPEFILKNITTPVLIINALDDPFLGERCYPNSIAENSKYVYLETPKYGGHCAFPLKDSKQSYAEVRAFDFFNERSFKK
ncbi:abhydrolase 6 [Formosa agariphila KMM 3901]|uniref:Abhydrolase 6 n=1 Tax=Formosa agariphila (strain DSM 15362 / KCTC 12365 / LMG 23005 / KMM 3901 / M-2Alg 35-1) TaxID=1347342 RepID=T2KKV6_FORAG|nr:alpha/beta fold hydrolase [Formosa agariphila]CDF79073.1 abhydrolase 6 [Formosa agariphila KMM 3901]